MVFCAAIARHMPRTIGIRQSGFGAVRRTVSASEHVDQPWPLYDQLLLERDDLGRHVFHHPLQIAIGRVDLCGRRAREVRLRGAVAAGKLRINVCDSRLVPRIDPWSGLRKASSRLKSRGTLSPDRWVGQTNNNHAPRLGVRAARSFNRQARPNTRLKIVSTCAK